MLICLTGCASVGGAPDVRPAACDVWDTRKAAFPLDDIAGIRSALVWAAVTDAAMAEACR